MTMYQTDETQHESSLELNLSEGPQHVLSTLQGIDRTAHFEQVCLFRNFPSPLRALTPENQVLEVLESLVTLPRAPYLKISYASGTFPIHLLMQALANHGTSAGQKSSVETLDLLGVKLCYQNALAATSIIQEHHSKLSLKSICIENCKKESHNHRTKKREGEPLDLFVAALSAIQSIERLSLCLIEQEVLNQNFVTFPYLRKLHLERLHVSEQSLHNIGQSPHLQDLSLQCLVDPPQNTLLLALSRVLATTQSLRILKLKFVFHNLHCLDEHAHTVFWDAVQQNTTLQDLELTVNWRMNPYDSLFGIPLARALQNNRSLQRLSLVTRIDDNEAARDNLKKSIGNIAAALPFNETLKQFQFSLSGGLRGYCQEQVRSLLLGPFETVLREGEQHGLECLSVWYRGVGHLELTEKMQFYLTLNRAGRRHLLSGNATINDWMDALILHQSDLSVVFFLLSRNPLLSQANLGLQSNAPALA
jgi:hypothetical protein